MNPPAHRCPAVFQVIIDLSADHGSNRRGNCCQVSGGLGQWSHDSQKDRFMAENWSGHGSASHSADHVNRATYEFHSFPPVMDRSVITSYGRASTHNFSRRNGELQADGTKRTV